MASSKTQFGRDVLIAGIATAIKSLRNLIMVPVITYNLTQAEYGMWALIAGAIAFAIPWVSLQLPSALIRFLAGENNRDTLREGIYTILIFSCFTSTAASLLIYASLPLLNNTWEGLQPFTSYAPSILALIPLTTLLNVSISYLRTFRLMIHHSLLTIFQHFGEIILVALAVNNSLGLAGALWGITIIRAIIALIGTLIIVKRIGLHWPEFRNLSQYMSFSLPLIPNSSFYRLFDAGDRYIINGVLGSAAVGLYEAAYTAGSVFTSLTTPIQLVLLPTMAEMWNREDIAGLKEFMGNALRYSLLLTIPALLGIFVLAHPILLLIVPASYGEASAYFSILCLSFFIFSIGIFGGNLLTTVGHTRFLLLIDASLASCNILLNLFLVPAIGIMGAVLSTLASHLFYAIFVLHRAHRIVPFGVPFKTIAHYSGAAITMAIAISLTYRFFTDYLGVLIVEGIVVYFGCLVLTGGFTRREYRYIIGLVSRK